MSLPRELLPKSTSEILHPSQYVESNVVDPEVHTLLMESNLALVILILISRLLTFDHEPTGGDLSLTQDRYYMEIRHLMTILSSYFQSPDGNAQLNAYFSHSGRLRHHPILVALTAIYKPFSPHIIKNDMTWQDARIKNIENKLILRAQNHFDGIRLPALLQGRHLMVEAIPVDPAINTDGELTLISEESDCSPS